MNQSFPKEGEYKVEVQCITYNHSQYIEDTLKGFAMQQTNFPFICCIFDDASTDGEQDVLKRWVENHCNAEDVEKYDHPLAVILKSPDKNNPNCIYVIHLQKVNTWGKPEKREMMAYWEKQCKYIALCEGDDYWIDPFKLQKQVNIMDEEPQISLCYTRNESYSVELDKITEVRGIDCVDFRSFLIYDETITPTAMMRSSQLNQYIQEIQPYTRGWLMGDTPLWLWLSKNGKVHPIDKITARYNAHEGSVSRTGSYERQIEFNKSALDIRLFFINFYNDCLDLIPQEYDKFYRNCMITSYQYKKFCKMIENFMKIKHRKKTDFIYLIKFWPRVLLR